MPEVEWAGSVFTNLDSHSASDIEAAEQIANDWLSHHDIAAKVALAHLRGPVQGIDAGAVIGSVVQTLDNVKQELVARKCEKFWEFEDLACVYIRVASTAQAEQVIALLPPDLSHLQRVSDYINTDARFAYALLAYYDIDRANRTFVGLKFGVHVALR